MYSKDFPRKADEPTMELSRMFSRLSEFCLSSAQHPLPEDVCKATKEVILDIVAAALFAQNEREIRSLRKAFANGNGGTSHVWGYSDVYPVPVAALVNGAAATALEFDEGNRFAAGHPGAHVVPAAIAVAEMTRAPGTNLLTAVAIGYEIAARFGRATRLWQNAHPHGTWGIAGSAVATLILLGSPASQIENVLAAAGSLMIHTDFQTAVRGATVRNWYAGLSNMHGVLLGLCCDGILGDADSWARLCEDFDADSLVQDLGETWFITRNYFKPYAACRYTHGAIEAIQSLRSQFPELDFTKCREIWVDTYSSAAQLSDLPHNTLSAKFSIPHAVAVSLMTDPEHCQAFSNTFLYYNEIRRLSKKVVVRSEPSFDRLLPNKRPTQVTIVMDDGRRYSSYVDIPKGEFDRPIPEEQRKKKILDKLTYSLGQSRAERLCQAFEQLETWNSVADLVQKELVS